VALQVKVTPPEELDDLFMGGLEPFQLGL